MLNRDPTWFYERSAGELSAKIVENSVLIVGSLGNEFRGLFYFYGFSVGSYCNWQLTQLVGAVIVVLVLECFAFWSSCRVRHLKGWTQTW